MKIGNTEYIEIKRSSEVGVTGKDYPEGCFIDYEIKTEYCTFLGKEYIDIKDIKGINKIIEQFKIHRKGQHKIKVGYDGDLIIKLKSDSGVGPIDVSIEARAVYHDKSNQFREQKVIASFSVKQEYVNNINKL